MTPTDGTVDFTWVGAIVAAIGALVVVARLLFAYLASREKYRHEERMVLWRSKRQDHSHDHDTDKGDST